VDEGANEAISGEATVTTQALNVARDGATTLALAAASIVGVVIIAVLLTPLGDINLFAETRSTVGAPSFVDPYREFVQAPAADAPSFADPYRQFVEASR
jgi:hypothetical protein